jgi:hypothetical protein
MAKKNFIWRMGRLSALLQETGVSEDYVDAEIRKKPEGTYWFRTPGSSKILYNIDLIRDWLVNGDCPAHQKAVKRYLASLPSTDAA